MIEQKSSQSQNNTMYMGMVLIAVLTLIGHATTYLQNREAREAAVESTRISKDSAKVLAEVKTDVNSKSDKAADLIKSQREEITKLFAKVSVLEEKLLPKPVVPVRTDGTVTLTEDQFQRLLNRKE